MNEKIFGDITPIELTFVIVFSIAFISTVNFPLTISILIGFALILALISFVHKSIKKDRIKKTISGYLIIIVPILFVIDACLTYYSVLHTKIANEANPFVLFLWYNFGTIWGEVSRMLIFLGLMTILFYMNKSPNEKRRSASSYLLLFMYFMWILVVTSNTIQLI